MLLCCIIIPEVVISGDSVGNDESETNGESCVVPSVLSRVAVLRELGDVGCVVEPNGHIQKVVVKISYMFLNVSSILNSSTINKYRQFTMDFTEYKNPSYISQSHSREMLI